MFRSVAFTFASTVIACSALADERPNRSTFFPSSSRSVGIERIIGENNLEPIENAIGTPFYEMSRPVARVEMGGGYCTGTRVGAELMLTNNHCLDSCSSMIFRFGYERAVPREQHVTFRCKSVVATDSSLDYALIRVEVETGDADSVPIATLDRRELQVDQLLFLSGHPAARLKEMDRSANCKIARVATASDKAIAHTCDTESGNSGSSVWDREAQTVVALHWGYTDLNRGTWIDPILTDVERRAPAVMSELTIVD